MHTFIMTMIAFGLDICQNRCKIAVVDVVAAVAVARLRAIHWVIQNYKLEGKKNKHNLCFIT